MASPWTTSSDNPNVIEQTEEKGSVPTLPNFLSYGRYHFSTNKDISDISIICSLLLSLDTIGFYVIQKEHVWTFEFHSFPNDEHIIIKVDIYKNSPSGFILDFFNLRETNNRYREQLEKIWNFLQEKEMWNDKEVFTNEYLQNTLSRSRKEWLVPHTEVKEPRLEVCLKILQNKKVDELFYAASLLANIVNSDKEKLDQCRVFIMVTITLLSLNEKKESVYLYNETVRILSVVLRILYSKDIQDLSKLDQVMNIEKILEHHTEPEEKEETPIYQETIKNFKIVLDNLQGKKD